MFCGKCGKQVPDGIKACPECGWQLPKSDFSRSASAQSESFDENKTVYAESPVEPRVNKNRSGSLKTDKHNSGNAGDRQRGKASGPDNQRYKPQSGNTSGSARESRNEYERKTAPPPPRKRIHHMSQPVPQPVHQQPQAQDYHNNPAPQKSGKAALIIAIVTASLVLVLIGGYFASRIYYRNSDPYKISQAEQNILNGDIDKGLNTIENVRGAQADAVREFAKLMRCREEYSSNYKPDKLQGSDDPVKASYDKLTEAYIDFSAYDDLPEKLKKRYNLYSSRLAEMSEVLAGLKMSDLTDAQRGVLSFGNRKRGDGFTTGDLENVIRITDPAVKAIDAGVMQKPAFGELKSHSSASAVKVMQEFFDNVSLQLEQDKFDLNDYLSKGKSGFTLKFDSPDPDYQAVVSNSLKPLNSEEDASANSNTLYTALCYAWMAYSYDI